MTPSNETTLNAVFINSKLQMCLLLKQIGTSPSLKLIEAFS